MKLSYHEEGLFAYNYCHMEVILLEKKRNSLGWGDRGLHVKMI